jgi:hypothetical protein
MERLCRFYGDRPVTKPTEDPSRFLSQKQFRFCPFARRSTSLRCRDMKQQPYMRIRLQGSGKKSTKTIIENTLREISEGNIAAGVVFHLSLANC